MFLTVCLNPTIQKTYKLAELRTETINRTAEAFLDISGKGINVTRVLKALGEDAVHLTHTGGAFSSFFRERALREGLHVKAVRTKAEIRFCVTLIDAAKRQVTEIVEEGFPVDPGTESEIRRAFSRLLLKCNAVIISGSKAPGYSGLLFPDLVRLARQADAFVLADFRGADLLQSLPHGPHVIKPNLTEFIETFFPDVDPVRRDGDLLGRVGEKMTQLAINRNVASVITDGGRPILYTDEKTVKRFSPRSLEPVNTTGCGDAFAAAFAPSFLKTRRMEEAVRFAEACAARNALQVRPGFIG